MIKFKKIIKTSDTPTGNLTLDQEDFCRLINEFPMYDDFPEQNFSKKPTFIQSKFIQYKKNNPGFKREDKPYRYFDNVPSNTKSHGWHFAYNDVHYVALSVDLLRYSRAVLFYRANEKGKFKIGIEHVIAEYPLYVNIESAVDDFVKKIEKGGKI
jgi:hypothetical protein